MSAISVAAGRNTRMVEHIRSVLSELRRQLAELYGPRLCGLYLFGSFARGEQDPDSDIDVLIVLDRVDNYYGEITRTSGIVSALSLACNRSISCVYATQEQWKQEESMFFSNVRKEAVPT